GFLEVLQERLTVVRNVPRDFFRTQLRITRLDFEFFDMNRSVVVVFDETFGNQNRVFKVVSAPGHESDKHIAAKGKFSSLCAGAIGQHLTFHNALAFSDDRLLVDAGVLVGSLELRERINIRAHFAREMTILSGFNADDDAFRIDRIDDSVAAANHDSPRIASGDLFHTSPNERGRGAEQRNGLTL